jgi:formylglycine-generating enzyme
MQRAGAARRLLLLVTSVCVAPVGIAAAVVTRAPGTTFQDCAHCPQMRVVPGGRFTVTRKLAMDGQDGFPPSLRPPQPPRDATIAKAFAISVFDITREEYARFVRDSGWSDAKGCYLWIHDHWAEDLTKNWRDPGFEQTARDPVVCVSALDGQAFVGWLNALVRKSAPLTASPADGPYRLPTWEEEEYAAGGGAHSTYYWGDSPDRNQANYGGDDCFPCRPYSAGGDKWLYTSPVGSFPPNPFGLYDMAGNVWQWTDYCVPDDPPYGPCLWGTVHGGSWLDGPNFLKTGEYNAFDRRNHNNATGFRVVRTLD